MEGHWVANWLHHGTMQSITSLLINSLLLLCCQCSFSTWNGRFSNEHAAHGNISISLSIPFYPSHFNIRITQQTATRIRDPRRARAHGLPQFSFICTALNHRYSLKGLNTLLTLAPQRARKNSSLARKKPWGGTQSGGSLLHGMIRSGGGAIIDMHTFRPNILKGLWPVNRKSPVAITATR